MRREPAGRQTPPGPLAAPKIHQPPPAARADADAEEPLGDDGEAYKKAIVDRYPTYGGPFVIDIANRYLFGAGHA